MLRVCVVFFLFFNTELLAQSDNLLAKAGLYYAPTSTKPSIKTADFVLKGDQVIPGRSHLFGTYFELVIGPGKRVSGLPIFYVDCFYLSSNYQLDFQTNQTIGSGQRLIETKADLRYDCIGSSFQMGAQLNRFIAFTTGFDFRFRVYYRGSYTNTVSFTPKDPSVAPFVWSFSDTSAPLKGLDIFDMGWNTSLKFTTKYFSLAPSILFDIIGDGSLTTNPKHRMLVKYIRLEVPFMGTDSKRGSERCCF